MHVLSIRHVLILGGLGAFGSLSTDMYVPALPTLSHDLGTTISQVQITLSAGMLGLALGQLLAGPISDMWGRKRPLLAGIAIFIIASLLCAVAPDVSTLTILRLLQGTAGATGMVIALAMVRDLYAGNAMARFLSILMLVNGLAPIVAPIIGSQLLRWASWHGIFLTLATIGAVLLLASIFGLSETLPLSRRQSAGIVGSINDFRMLMTDRGFVGYVFSSGFAVVACLIYVSVSPFILESESIYGLSPQSFGLLLSINALGMVTAGQINGRLVSRFSPRRLLIWGLAGNALAGLSLLIVTLSNIGLIGVLPSLFVLLSSLGLILPNATTLALANERAAGSASALLGMIQLSMGAIAAPLIGLGGTTSALPMAASIAAFGLAAPITYILFFHSASLQTESIQNNH
ncbi:Bcr/CflA family drug resistance efflux transporter [Reticulibacter mediterranei]|uniref:Bcr/CflA family drug resistance efflux transporter n=2 Tax=Reticulibacter mediterranei TaxID=2778369 RepID=A0A8J3N4I1_9CHLR|nr:Bcr/CflA family drug resistance efflux transporter [Reticulibacter mediterranei]